MHSSYLGPLPGLERGHSKVFVAAYWQGCRVHSMSKALAKLSCSRHPDDLCQADRSHVRAQLLEVAGTSRAQFADVADKLDDAGEHLIALAASPSPHWTNL